MEELPRPSVKRTRQPAYSAITLFRLGPAPRPYFFQSARNSFMAMLFCSAQTLPSLSAPGAP